MKRQLLSGLVLITSLSFSSYAQELRERTYYYEILQPNHADKPKVEGFATERIKEKFNRRLIGSPAQEGKSVYLSWRLLDTDPTNVSFHVYRSVNGKTKRINSKAVSQTCDFTDTHPAGEATYWVVPVSGKKELTASEKTEVSPCRTWLW